MTIGSQGNKSPRDRSSLESQLARQMRWIETSCGSFDGGDHDEAGRLATSLRVLPHDTQNSKSLLGLLGLKDVLRFVDTGLYRARLNEALQAWLDREAPGTVVVADGAPQMSGLSRPR